MQELPEGWKPVGWRLDLNGFLTVLGCDLPALESDPAALGAEPKLWETI